MIRYNFDKISISHLVLSKKFKKILEEYKIFTIGDLILYTQQELLTFKGLGSVALNKICYKLKSKYNIVLKLDLPKVFKKSIIQDRNLNEGRQRQRRGRRQGGRRQRGRRQRGRRQRGRRQRGRRRRGRRRRTKARIPKGVVHITTTFNNTIVNVTDRVGNTLSWASSGSTGSIGVKKKRTPLASRSASYKAASQAYRRGMRKTEVVVNGPRYWRHRPAIRGVRSAGLRITKIKNTTQYPHNGCRPPKKRRI